jgi:hypothetical protein
MSSDTAPVCSFTKWSVHDVSSPCLSVCISIERQDCVVADDDDEDDEDDDDEDDEDEEEEKEESSFPEVTSAKLLLTALDEDAVELSDN